MMKRSTQIILALLILTVGLLIALEIGSGRFGAAPERVAGKQVRADGVKVVFLDIGQGDATFIEWPDGTQMLIDCAKDARILEALGRVMPFYDFDIDYLVVTHPDLDHYGGCVDVLEKFTVSNIVYNGYNEKINDYWQSYWAAAWAEGAAYHEITERTVWQLGSTTIDFLYPDHELAKDPDVPGFDKDTGSNNSSLVLKLSVGEQDALFTGDAEEELEEFLVSAYGDELDVEVLKLGHHGSAGSSIQPFIDITTPEYAIASAGKNNSYGHPSPRVEKRIERAGAEMLRTDLQGDITLMLYPDEVVVVE